jgi:hypothetical protein
MRDRGELKLICLANAVNIYNPTCAVLDIVDDIAYMADKGAKSKDSLIMTDDERGIFIRLLPVTDEMRSKEKDSFFFAILCTLGATETRKVVAPGAPDAPK